MKPLYLASGGIALQMLFAAQASELVSNVCVLFHTPTECWTAHLEGRSCGWDSQIDDCSRGSEWTIDELELLPDDVEWSMVVPNTTHVVNNTFNCKSFKNACSCSNHEYLGCGWKSAIEYQKPLGIFAMHSQNGAYTELHGVGECHYSKRPNTNLWELENSNSYLAVEDEFEFNCTQVGCTKFDTPCECYAHKDEGCGWSSSDFRDVDEDYIRNKYFYNQGRCKNGSTTLGIEVAFAHYMEGTSDECLKDETTALVDCETFTTECECWELGVVLLDARCGWSSANNNCNFLSRFSEKEVSGCMHADYWTRVHLEEFNSSYTTPVSAAAHVAQNKRVWDRDADDCWFQNGDRSSDIKADRCNCFSMMMGDVQSPAGQNMQSCSWSSQEEICQADAAWDISMRPRVWAQEAFQCLSVEERRGLCDPFNSFTKACACKEWADQIPNMDWYDAEDLANLTGDPNILQTWERVNYHINGFLYPLLTEDEIKTMTPFLASSCYQVGGEKVSASLHDECIDWQWCGYSTTESACLHGKHFSDAELADALTECPPETTTTTSTSTSTSTSTPGPTATPGPGYNHTYIASCSDISDPILCALYSIPSSEADSAPFAKSCAWNSGDSIPCHEAVLVNGYAQSSTMELQELMFTIENGINVHSQVKVGGAVYVTQYYSRLGSTESYQSLLSGDASLPGADLWVPHLPTLSYHEPWRPFVEEDTCYVISDILHPYVPQSYRAEGKFDDEDSLYNCQHNGDYVTPSCSGPYPSVTNLHNPFTATSYLSGLEWLVNVILRYIDVTENDNTGPSNTDYCNVECLADRAAVLSLDSSTRAPLTGLPDVNATYTHSILLTLDGTPILYTPCVNNGSSWFEAKELYRNGHYDESGLFGS